jgi:3-oxoacyl-[acyl-carrier-protein] synthase II
VAAAKEPVAITGIGIVSPLGTTREATWEGLVAGRSGARPITRFDASGYATRFAAEVPDFDPVAVVGRKDARRLDRFAQFAVAAGREAIEHAGLEIGPANAERVGVLVGTGMGGLETIDSGAEVLLRDGPGRLSPFFVPMMLPNMASGTVAIALGARGPNFAPTSACASSAHAIGEAAEMIRRGMAEVMLAGGAEAPIARLGVGGFNAMGALSTRNDDPAGASRPFDAERDGFVLGEGAAILVLESLDRARRRGARPLAIVSGYGATDDANHMVQPAPGGEGAGRAITAALADAGLEPPAIGYVNAHGTSTQLNEKLETQALKAALGEHAYRVPISSTKSMTGHLLGAAGGLEAGVCVLAMERGCLPPTINYRTPDPACDLDYVPNVARAARVEHALNCSMGFGGHNVALVLSAVPD